MDNMNRMDFNFVQIIIVFYFDVDVALSALALAHTHTQISFSPKIDGRIMTNCIGVNRTHINKKNAEREREKNNMLETKDNKNER